MRSYIIFLACTIYTQCLVAQSETQINDWLYSLPVSKSSVSLRKEIIKSGQFKEDKNLQATNFKHTNSTYKGTVILPTLPFDGDLDSAIISLNVGSLKSTDSYSGKMKWLFLEYFSSDTIFLNYLYDSASKHLMLTSIEQKPTGHRIPDDVEGKGMNFIYVNNSHRLRSISVSRVRYVYGKQSFIIIYACSGK